MIRAILVDDDQYSIDTLRQCLDDFKETIKVINTYTDTDKAVAGIRKEKPDVLFLDINMKSSMNGISLAKETIGHYGELIFVTGHKKYWPQAFEVHAFQYLLKPIRPDTLSPVINDLTAREKEDWPGQWQQRIGELGEVKGEEDKVKYFDYIWLTKTGSKVLHKVFWNEIVLFEGRHNNEVLIYTTSEVNYIRKNTTLVSIEQDILKLEDRIKKNFYRINNRHILNYEHAISFSPAIKQISVNKKGLKPLVIREEYPDALAAIKRNILANRDKKRGK